MKIKLMPLLAGLITLSAVATPIIVNAQADTSTQAQPGQTTRQRHQGKWNKLGLSDTQKQQMRQIHTEMRAEIYKTVLTPQQQAQMDTARQNRQAGQNRQADPAGQARQGGKRGFMAALNLTDAQKTQMKTIKQSYKTRMQAILTPAQQQQLEQMRQQRQQMRQQRQQQQGN
jgi:Spy/CpxP family protein refolding chaperone